MTENHVIENYRDQIRKLEKENKNLKIKLYTIQNYIKDYFKEDIK